MESFDFVHSGSFEQKTPNKHFDNLASKLKEFKNWKTIDVCGLRSADDEIVFVMYRDDSGNFRQYNSKVLVESYKQIINDLELADRQWAFYDEVLEAVRPQLVDSKNLRFLETSLTFTKDKSKVKRFVTFNIAERVVQK